MATSYHFTFHVKEKKEAGVCSDWNANTSRSFPISGVTHNRFFQRWINGGSINKLVQVA
jgi:hypothetical protein